MLTCPHCKTGIQQTVPARAMCPACGGALGSEPASLAGAYPNAATADIGATFELPAAIPTTIPHSVETSDRDGSTTNAKSKTVPMDRGALGATVDFPAPVQKVEATPSGAAAAEPAAKAAKKTVPMDPAAGSATVDFGPPTKDSENATLAAPTSMPPQAEFDWTKYVDGDRPQSPPATPQAAEKKTVKIDPGAVSATIDF